MKKSLLLTLALALTFVAAASAQKGVSTPYDEPVEPAPADLSAWQKLDKKLYASWASRDVIYRQREVPALQLQADTVLCAWRGERIGMEALLFAPEAQGNLGLKISCATLPAEVSFVNFTTTDDFRGCGTHPTDRTPFMVGDVVDDASARPLAACFTRPVWCSVEVPRDATPGTHRIGIDVTNDAGEAVASLTLRIEVRADVLPAPADYAFNVNFWQQPYALSRYYGLEPWSEAHFDALRPYMKMLARAGQKVATTILFYEPWGEQSNDKFEPMVQTTRRADGSWSYDYTVFDAYVELLAECGISKQINCFSMVPWDMNFRFFDEATGQFAHLKTSTSTPEYEALWTSFLTSFAEHLRAKGWFEKTVIAMDERGLSAMQDAYRIAQNAVPGIKMALAGNYHPELALQLYDYCVAWGQRFSDSELQARTDAGLVTSIYTACPDGEPNICSNNNPSDAAYLPLHALSIGFNGFLRWAWMNWTDDPLVDTRFRLFTPGDTYVVYPGNRSGIRFERFIEGVQACEKVRILRQKYAADGNTDALAALNAALAKFQSGEITETASSARLVSELQSLLNAAPKPAHKR